jgi:hypothetical protein
MEKGARKGQIQGQSLEVEEKRRRLKPHGASEKPDLFLVFSRNV